MRASPLLKNVWYFGLPSSWVKAARVKQMEICGEPVVFFRDSSGKVSAVRDICPHRGIPLSYGKMVGDDIECSYHGWKFNGQGVCTEIPSIVQGQDLDCKKVKIRSFPTYESYGMVWIYFGDKDSDSAKAPPIPQMSYFPKDKEPNLLEVVTFPCHVDHAVIGLMDPAHGPYVHKAWFWRSTKSVYEKAKKFAPVPFGFQMVRHPPSKNSKAYKILGGQPTTEITFSLPSVRVEHIKIGDRNVVSFTALTPQNEKATQVFQMLFWDMPWLSTIKPVISKFARVFLHQDMDAVTKQQEGLKFDPSLMLIKDADTQAKWYYGLKEEWIQSQNEKREFKNPVQESVLRWRS